MATCTNCSCNPCCCPEPHPVPAPPIISVESHPAAIPECPSCPPVIHETFNTLIIPEIDDFVPIEVCDTDAWPVGMCVHITDGNKKAVLKIVSVNSSAGTIDLRNDGSSQTDAGGSVLSGEVHMVLHGICPDEEEEGCWVFGLRTISPITVPDQGGQTEIQLNTCATLKEGQKLFIEGFGCVDVVSQSQESPFAIATVQFDDLYDSSPGDSITGGAYVTTADFCYPADFCTKVVECLPTLSGYLNGGENSTLWNLNDSVGVDPNLSVTATVNAGDIVEIKGNCQMESPRGSLRFEVTGTAGAAPLVSESFEYEDGTDGLGPDFLLNGGGNATSLQQSPYQTAHQTEIWQAATDGTVIAKWQGVVGTSGNNPSFNSHKRTIIILRV